MVKRDLEPRLRDLARSFPVLTLTGPRQSGKSTLCRAVFPRHGYANLEAPDVRAFAERDPRGFLAQFPDGAVIDEVQNVPSIPSYLQSIVDDDPAPGRWVLTGSQNLAVAATVSQSLAGRTAVLHLLPLSRREVERFDNAPSSLDETLVTGGYPRILDQRLSPADWLGSYVATYLERDVRGLSNIGDLALFQRFVQLCAGRTAQLLNLTALASDGGVSQPTAKAWLSILEATFICFRLQPWHANLSKRLTKTPKLHFCDTGLACWLLDIRTPSQLKSHPLRGAIFETWVVTELLKHRTNRGLARGLHFYRDAQHREVDALVQDGGDHLLVEAKAGQTVAGDALAALGEVAGVVGEPVRSLLVTGGSGVQRRTGVAVVGWADLAAELDTAT